jgi:hypothetical protein
MDRTTEFLFGFDEMVSRHDHYGCSGLDPFDKCGTESDARCGIAASRLSNHLGIGNQTFQLIDCQILVQRTREYPGPSGRNNR